MTLIHLFHNHNVDSVITAHNFTPVERDDWNSSWVCPTS